MSSNPRPTTGPAATPWFPPRIHPGRRRPLAVRVLGAVVARPLRHLADLAAQLTGDDAPTPRPAPATREATERATASRTWTPTSPFRVARSTANGGHRKLLGWVLRSQEEERHRIAQDLHDELGGSLSALLMDIRARRRECVEPDEQPAHWAGLEDQLTTLIRRVRQMAWSLRPAVLDDHGLDSALAQHVEALREATGLDIDVCCTGLYPDGSRLPAEAELCLYRVAQEALANAVQHSGAGRISVIVMRRPGAVTLLVEDDGHGFAARDALARGEHVGLLGMQERVEAVGGDLVIDSGRGRGTTVRASLPLGDPAG